MVKNLLIQISQINPFLEILYRKIKPTPHITLLKLHLNLYLFKGMSSLSEVAKIITYIWLLLSILDISVNLKIQHLVKT